MPAQRHMTALDMEPIAALRPGRAAGAGSRAGFDPRKLQQPAETVRQDFPIIFWLLTEHGLQGRDMNLHGVQPTPEPARPDRRE